MRDLEVLQYYFNSMEEACTKLEAAVGINKVEDANKLKKFIVDISDKISEELG
jgi:hypothetical protein